MPFKFITWAKKAQDILGYDYQKGTPPEAMSKIVESKNITLTFDRDGNSFPTMSYNGGYYSILFEEKNGSTLEVSGKQKVLVDVSGSDLWLEYYGEVGVDIVKAGSHSATIEGRGGNDELTGGRAEDYLSGGIGNDEVSGGGGNDFLHGDNGDDRLAGAGGSDVVSGGNGEDRIDGEGSRDELFGNAGDDKIDGGTGSDQADGGKGADEIIGGTGRDELAGGDGDDRIFGGKDDDTLMGGAGRDELNGGEGDDVLVASQGGGDVMTGGRGIDSFVVDDTPAESRIADFDVKHETIEFARNPSLDFEDLKFKDRPGGVLIVYDIASEKADGSIFLDDVRASQLSEDNFLV